MGGVSTTTLYYLLKIYQPLSITLHNDFHVFFSGVICCLALKSDVLGINMECTGPWCWIRGDLDEKTMITWMLLAGKGWEGLCYFAAANLYILPKLYRWIRVRFNSRYLKVRVFLNY